MAALDQGTGPRIGGRPGRGARRAVPGRLAPGRRVLPRRPAGDRQETLLWDGSRAGGVPHPRGRLDRAGPAAAGRVPGRRRRAACPSTRAPWPSSAGRPGPLTPTSGSTPSPWTTRPTSGSAWDRPRASRSPGRRAVPRCSRSGSLRWWHPAIPHGLREPVRGLVVALARAGVTATCSMADGPRYGSIDVDSNLPDFRIALGGPAQNPFTSAAAGGGQSRPSPPSWRNSWPRTGTARVWVPAGAEPGPGLRSRSRPARPARPAGADRGRR